MKLSTRFAAVALACAAIYGREARAQIIIGSGGGGSGGGGGGVVQGSGMAGAPAGGVLTVQGSPSGTPIPVTGSFSAAAAAPTIGATKTMTGNSSCATVWLAGQNGASFFFSSGGSLATTLTPVVYDDATQSGNGCTGGTAIPISFIDPLTAATSSTLVVSNVNVGTLLNLRTGTALCAAVCTASSGTTGTATGFLVASSQVLPAAASGSGGGAVNITQINGTTVLTGAGVSGAGAMRVAAATSDGNVLATANTGRLQVDVVTGGGSNASVGATGSAVPASATLVGGSKSGNTAALLLDASGNLNVNVAAGGGSGGTSSSFGSAFPATGTAVGAKDSTGANLAALNLDASGFLKVNVAAGGGSGGTSSTFGAASPGTGTAAGGFTTTAAPTYVTGNMGALSLTTAGELRSIITSALPAGTNVLGHVIADTGSTTAVTALPATPAGTNLIGKVGIDQTTPGTTNGVQVNAALPAGTNVIGHVIHDSGSTTAVTGNVTVVQPTGTSLHVVADSTSTTAATQATAANLNAQVQGAAASGASKSGNPVQQGLVFNTAQPTVTTGQVVEAQATARGAQIVATGADTFSVAVTSAPTTAVTIATLPALTAGSAVIGHTINDSGSTTAVTSLPAIPTGSNTIGAVTGPAAAALALDATLTGGTLKAKVTGNGGAAMDAAGQNASSPANELLIAGQFNTTPTTITSGNVSPLQVDNAGNLLVNIKAGASSGAVAQGSTTSGQTGGLIQAASTSAAPSYSNATTNPLSTDLAGNLRVSAGAPANVSTTGTISAQCTNGNINTACTSGRVTINVTGQAGATFKLVNANVTQTGYVIDCSYDNAATWETGNAILDSTTAPSANLSFTTDSTTTYWSAICRKANPNFIGLRASAAITNSSTVTWTAGLVPGGPTLFTSTPGGATPQQLVVVQGSSTGTAVGVGGTVASGGSNAGNPIKEGFVAHTALPTAGTDNQIFDGMADKFGRTVTVANGDRALITEGALITLTASTAETTLLTAGGANVLLDLTYWHCDNSSATAVTVSFRDATAGTVRDTYAIPAGGSNGAVLQVPWKQNAANGNWTVQSSASVTSLFCRAQAVQNK